MTRRKDEDDLQKHTMHLRRGDMDKLALIIPNQPAAKIVRRIVSSFVDKHLNAGQQIPTLPEVNLPEN